MKRFAIALVGVLFAGGCGGGLVTVSVPLAEIQKKLDEKFPIAPMGEGGGAPFTMQLSHPVASLDEAGGRVNLALDLEVKQPEGAPEPPKPPLPEGLPPDPAQAPDPAAPSNAPADPPPGAPKLPPGPPGPGAAPPGSPKPGEGPAFPPPPAAASLEWPGASFLAQPAGLPAPPKTIAGKLVISGRPEFDPASKSLFIRDPRVEKIDIEGLPDPINEPLQALAQAKLAEKFADSPIPLPTDPGAEIAKALVKKIGVSKDAVTIELGF